MRRRAGLLLLAALALFGAGLWSLPRLLDWGAQRERLAALVGERLGRQVAIHGPVALVLLPDPRLEAFGVAMAQGPDGIAGEARALRLRLALGKLLLGRIAVREVALIGAEIRLPWPPPAVPGLAPPPWLAALDARLEDSRILVGDAAIEGVFARVTAGGPAEAVRAEGRLRWRETQLAFEASLGRAGDDGIAPLDLAMRGAGALAQARGILLAEGGFEGRFDAQGPDLAALLPAPPGPFRARGTLRAGGELVAADALALDLRAGSLRGAASLRLDPTPRADIALTAARLDLEPWLAALRAAGAQPVPLALDLSAELAELGPLRLRRLRGAAWLEEGRLTLAEVAADLPGGAQAELSGATSGPRLDMRLRLRAARPRELAASLGLPAAIPIPAEAVEGEANLSVEGASLAATDIALRFGSFNRVAGGVTWRGGGGGARPALALGLEADELRLGGGAGGGGAGGGGAGGDGEGGAALLLAIRDAAERLDLSLRLAAARVLEGAGPPWRRVALDAAADPGRVVVRSLAAERDGAEFQLAGTFALAPPPARAADTASPTRSPDATPPARPLEPPAPARSGEATQPARAADALAPTQRADPPPHGSDAASRTASAPAAAAQLPEAGASPRAAHAALPARSRDAASPVPLAAAPPVARLADATPPAPLGDAPPPARLADAAPRPRLPDTLLWTRLTDATLEARGAAGAVLAPLLGPAALPGPAAGLPLRLRATAQGPAEAMQFRAEADFAEARLEAQGALHAEAWRGQGSVTMRHPGATRLLSSLGLSAPWLGPGSFSVVANLLVDASGGWQAEHLDIVAGEARLRAAGSLARAGDGWRATGRVQAEELPLPAAPVLLALRPAPAIEAAIALAAQRLRFAGLPPLEDAVAELRAGGGGLRVERFRARLLDGGIEGALSLEPGTPPSLAASLHAADLLLPGRLGGGAPDLQAGRLAGEAALRAQGHSPEALLGSLAGEARVEARGGVLEGVDLAGVARALTLREAEAAEAALRRALGGGASPLTALTARLAISGGAARLEQGAVMADGAPPAALSGSVDLARGLLALRLAVPPPAAEGRAAPPEVALRVSGPFAAPRRTEVVGEWLRWLAAPPP